MVPMVPSRFDEPRPAPTVGGFSLFDCRWPQEAWTGWSGGSSSDSTDFLVSRLRGRLAEIEHQLAAMTDLAAERDALRRMLAAYDQAPVK